MGSISHVSILHVLSLDVDHSISLFFYMIHITKKGGGKSTGWQLNLRKKSTSRYFLLEHTRRQDKSRSTPRSPRYCLKINLWNWRHVMSRYQFCIILPGSIVLVDASMSVACRYLSIHPSIYSVWSPHTGVICHMIPAVYTVSIVIICDIIMSGCQNLC